MNLIPDINSVSMGTVGDNGAMGASLTEIKHIKKNSVEMDFPELEETGLWDGKSDDPFEIIQNHPESLKSFKCVTTADFVANLILGNGTARDGGGVDYTTLSDTTKYKSVRLISNAFEGEEMYIDIPKASFRIRPIGSFTRAGDALLEIMFTVASPRDASDEPLKPVDIYPQAASGRVVTPIITVDGNDFTIASTTDAAVIKYTITGLDPAGTGGVSYTTTVTVTEDLLIRAYATKAGMLDSHYTQVVIDYSA